jgi:8-oxo-dGTP diphosphatase
MTRTSKSAVGVIDGVGAQCKDMGMSDGSTLVTAAILVKGSDVLLARRPSGDRLAGYWELPGGKVEAGETPEQCLARELSEECGIEAAIGPLFAESTYRYPHALIHLLAFWVDRWSGELVLRAHDDHRWVAPRAAEQLTLAPADVPILARLRDELG